MKQPSHLDTSKDKEMIKHLLTSIDDDVNANKKVNKQHVKFLKLQKDQLGLIRDALAKKKYQLNELKEDSYTNQTLTRFEEYKMKRTLAQRKIVTMLITGVTVCMILVILQKYTPLFYIVPDIIFSSLFSIVTVITIYYLGKSIIDFSQRSTKNFDEYDWHGLKDPIVESTGNAGFDITAFDNIGNQDEITLKFSGKDANMINNKVNALKNSKNILSDLSMLGNNVHVGIVTNDIEEAEEIADRIAVINEGQILLVEDKSLLMKRLGKKRLLIELPEPIESVPGPLTDLGIRLHAEGRRLGYTYDMGAEQTGIPEILEALKAEGIKFNDVRTEQSSLEDIFIDLVAEES